MITFRTNGTTTTQSLTEWFFGKKFVKASIASAKRQTKKTGKAEFKFWQEGTGYLTITLNK